MARARFDRLSPEKQEAILAAAADEFAARGFEGASINRIIERAGSSKGALYYYFEDKADLLATVVRRALDRVLAAVEWPRLEEFTAEDYWDRVRELSLRMLEQVEAETWYMRLMWAFHRLREEPGARAATAGVLDWSREVASSFFGRGRELGVVRTDLPLDLLVEVYLAADEAGDRWLVEHWEELSETEQRRLVEARLDLIRDMLDARHMGWER
jgi:AcrR family transcriptional regulator